MDIEKILLNSIVAVLSLCAAALIGAVGFSIYNWAYMVENCNVIGQRIERRDAWVQFVQTGNVTVPIIHDAADVMVDYCVEWKPGKEPRS